MCRRFLEKDGFRFDQFTSTHATTHHMGISVRTSIETICSDHCVTTSLILLMFNTAAVSARTCWQRAAFSARDCPYEGIISFSLTDHPPSFNFSGKQRSMT